MPSMLSVAAHLISRTSSASSVCSDDSLASADIVPSLGPPDVIVDGPKRTRKRFTSIQLMMLEHLYHKASHPTREQREQLAKDAEISDVRSVTVWFQNKRQTDRRIHRQLSEPAIVPLHLQHAMSSPAPSMSLPPSSPFSDASGNTIHTARARTRTLSSASVASSLSTASLPATASVGKKRERDSEHDAWRHVRQKPARHLSLDAIAARTERTERAVLVPRSPPQQVASSSSPGRAQTPEPASEDSRCGSDGGRALWENMQSSPPAPEPAPRTERDLVRYGRRKYTLEYACAREMVGDKDKTRAGAAGRHHHHKRLEHAHKKRQAVSKRKMVDLFVEKAQEDEEVPTLEWDVDPTGDTDTEGIPEEAVTPSSSFGLGNLSVQDEQEKENTAVLAEMAKNETNEKEKETTVTDVHETRDDDMMDVAYVLCGLSQRR